jgi:hypothetical protein
MASYRELLVVLLIIIKVIIRVFNDERLDDGCRA